MALALRQAAILLALLPLPVARAADYCIDPVMGADSNPGTCAQPWATLGPSQTHPFASGDRILLSAARHVHPQTAWYMKPGVSWIGAGRDRTTVVFDRSVAVPFVRFRTGSAGSGPPSDLRPDPFTNSTVFADMTLENRGLATIGIDIGVTSADSSPTIRNVAIVGFPIGIQLHPASDERAAASTHAVITQAIIRDASDVGVLSFADVFYPKAVTEASTLTNVSARATNNGVFVKTLINDPRDSGMPTASPQLTNTTLVSTGGSALLLQSWLDDGVTRAPTQLPGGSLTATVRNSILSGSARYGIEETSPTTEPATVASNSLGGNTLGDYLDEGTTPRAAGTVGTGNLSLVPAFVSTATGDLHVLASSPTIDRLAPASAPALDVDGHARPQQAQSDLGADEWVPCTAIADTSATVQAPACTGQSSLLDASRSSIGVACVAGLRTEWFAGAALISTSPTFAVSPATATTYRLRVSCADPALSACLAETTVTIQPSTGPPTADAGSGQSACGPAGTNVSFDLAGMATAQAPSTVASTTWSATAGVIANPAAADTTLTLTGTGSRQDVTATFQVVDSAGCTASASVVLTLLPLPAVSLTDPGPQCVASGAASANVALSAPASGGTGTLAWSWTASEGTVTGSDDATLAVPVQDTTRTVRVSVTVTDDAGCSSSAARDVTLIPQPTAVAGPDIGRCGPPGPFSIPLDGSASTGEAPMRHQWSTTAGTLSDPTSPTPALDVTVDATVQAITVTLVVSDPSGTCTDTDEIQVTVGPGPVADAGADVDRCVRPGIASIPLDGSSSTGTGTLRYLWTSSGGSIAAPTDAVTRIDVDVSDFTRDVLAHLEVRDESGACVATDEVRLLLRPSPVASPGAQYSTLRSGGPTTDVALDGSTSLGEAPLGFAWTTTLGTFADTGTAASTLTSPTLVVPDAPITQRGQACLTVTAGNGCVSDPACADVVVLLEVVAPPHDTSPTLRVVKGPSADVVLSWQDSPVDAGHDAATRHEVWAATRACGPFAELLEIAAQPGANETRDPILVTAPPLRYYFVRSFNDGGTSVPAPPDGTLCR